MLRRGRVGEAGRVGELLAQVRLGVQPRKVDVVRRAEGLLESEDVVHVGQQVDHGVGAHREVGGDDRPAS